MESVFSPDSMFENFSNADREVFANPDDSKSVQMICKVSVWSEEYMDDLKVSGLYETAVLRTFVAKTMQFRRFIWKAFAWKILLSGRFSDFVVLSVDIWKGYFRAVWWRRDPQIRLEKDPKKLQNVASVHFEQMSTRAYQFKYVQFGNTIHQTPVVFIITKNM